MTNHFSHIHATSYWRAIRKIWSLQMFGKIGAFNSERWGYPNKTWFFTIPRHFSKYSPLMLFQGPILVSNKFSYSKLWEGWETRERTGRVRPLIIEIWGASIMQSQKNWSNTTSAYMLLNCLSHTKLVFAEKGLTCHTVLQTESRSDGWVLTIYYYWLECDGEIDLTL